MSALDSTPYLLSHKDNPVQWRAWSSAVLDEAAAAGKPIFLSIGYSGCHWCHVMNRESFSDPEIAKALNEDFIPVLVDRMQRPDVDQLYQAAANLMSTATTTQAANHNTYQVAIYTFDYGFNTVYAPSGLPSTNLSAAGSAAAGITMKIVYDNDCLTSSNCNQDTDTNFSSALQSLNVIMPAPGTGTSNTGDTPQEVVFLVTDGVEDKVVSSASACSKPTVSMGSGQYRCQQPFDNTWCTTVKNRGIRIAVLYTEYLQLPTNSWYNSYVAPFNSPGPSTGQIATNLQSCASPGLFYDVQSGGDITAALNALFQLVVASAAHLTQ